MSENEDQPKIIVDSDWKEQVAAEKEALRKKSEETEEAAGQSEETPPLPPASFETIISTFATQAMVSLGQFADLIEEGVPINLNHAQHLIDSLAVLEEKTKGNLSDLESGMLADVLQQLRMIYVQVKKAEATPKA